MLNIGRKLLDWRQVATPHGAGVIVPNIFKNPKKIECLAALLPYYYSMLTARRATEDERPIQHGDPYRGLVSSKLAG